jgi:hypothetical protein
VNTIFAVHRGDGLGVSVDVTGTCLGVRTTSFVEIRVGYTNEVPAGLYDSRPRAYALCDQLRGTVHPAMADVSNVCAAAICVTLSHEGSTRLSVAHRSSYLVGRGVVTAVVSITASVEAVEKWSRIVRPSGHRTSER